MLSQLAFSNFALWAKGDEENLNLHLRLDAARLLIRFTYPRDELPNGSGESEGI